MASGTPPPVISSVRMLQYANVGDLPVLARSSLFVDGVELAAVPCLAICLAEAGAEIQLHHCDSEWDSLGVSGYTDIAAAKSRAGSMYRGIEWIPSPYSQAQVNEFVERAWQGTRCSFCGRTPPHFARLITAPSGAAICNDCVARLRAGIAT